MRKPLILALAGVLVLGGLFALSISDRFSEYVATTFGDSFFSGEFALGKVVSVETRQESVEDFSYPVQIIQARFVTGPLSGQETTLRNTGFVSTDFNRQLHPGEIIVIGKSIDFEGEPYYMSDRFRLPALLLIVLVFILTVILVARWRGFTSLLGLGTTALILLGFVLPRIIQGDNPFWILLAGTFLIAVISMYLAHGINKQTSMAVLGTLATLGLALGIAAFTVYVTNVSGFGSEDAFYVKLNILDINLTGLLLGSVLIGALGILDDITISQAATVQQIRRANPQLAVRELYARGMAVGREHIASLVNTLVLAYTGASLPLVLLFVLNQGVVPYWSIVNGEPLAEEIIRTIVGSLALVLAVPITTLLAAYVFGRKTQGPPGGKKLDAVGD